MKRKIFPALLIAVQRRVGKGYKSQCRGSTGRLFKLPVTVTISGGEGGI